MRKRSTPGVPEHYLEFSNRLIAALCGEDEGWLDLAGGFALSECLDELADYGGFYYIADVFTRLICDSRALMERLNGAGMAQDPVQLLKSTSFVWHSGEYRAHYTHLFMIQPHNALVIVEGALSYEDVVCDMWNVIQGHILYFRNERDLRKDFETISRQSASKVLDVALKNIQTAIRQVDRPGRRRAINRLERYANRIRSTLQAP